MTHSGACQLIVFFAFRVGPNLYKPSFIKRKVKVDPLEWPGILAKYRCGLTKDVFEGKI